jgi:hypothetical protein
MTKAPTQIAIAWRDENTGSVAAVAAFRLYCEPSRWPQRMQQRFRGCVRRAGFAFHDGRCSYIARSRTRDERQAALCAELKAAGFQITAGDVGEGRAQ